MAGQTTFTQEMADTICERIADGKSLRDICKAEDVPSTSTVCKWLNEQSAFSEQYARAREAQADVLFGEMLLIADDGTNDFRMKMSEDGAAVASVDHDHIQRSRLRVDTRKWMASKLAPKKYGDKLELSGDPKRPVVSEVRFTIVDPRHSDG